MTLRMKPLLTLAIVGVVTATVTHASELSFNRDVRPLLSDRCFACHGPDEHNRKGKLPLDQPD